MKYIVITGGVMSGLGKGVTTASIGRLLKNRGYAVSAIKIDPYLNVDAGTMSPYQHGEVFVLKDGGEVDLDLGNYERFLDVELSCEHNITTGKVYQSVIAKERRGEYLGRTVQIIPHITDEIKSQIRTVAHKSGADVCLIEVGGTVGDIESMPFLEAVRQLRREEKDENVLLVHVTLVPSDIQGDQKTKPTQHSVKALRELGLRPDMIVARCSHPLNEESKGKIALFCDVPQRAVVSAVDVDEVYRVPSMLEREGMFDYIQSALALKPKHITDNSWENVVAELDALKTGKHLKQPKIAIVGKYTHLADTYISIREAIKHAAMACRCNPKLIWIEAEDIEKGDADVLWGYHGILVPGGFGSRGAEGKMKAIQYAREHDVPYLGLCFGMQLAVVEFARNVVGWEDAASSEWATTAHPVIDLLPEQKDVEGLGGTMRLGNYEVEIEEGTLAHRIYGTKTIVERHRHRYEVNPKFIPKLKERGLVFSGWHHNRMELLELPQNKFFIASQFHPEFKSRPGKPAPLFKAFLEAML
ncbi:MAG: glutamine hydrolyzing CTP synthase [Methermicoccaceae archaeon]